MVEHDETYLQAWTQAREKTQVQNGKPRQKAALHLSVVAVQSIACCVAVLLTLLLRVAGGDAYRSLQQSFRQALTRNEWVSAISLMWDGNPLEKMEKADADDVKGDAFTDEEPAQLMGFETAVGAMAPLAHGTLTSGYGERIHPIDGNTEFHTGVDIAAPKGSDLRAVYAGKVVEVGEDLRLGKYILINHGEGIEILYGHCDAILAEPGAVVRAGECVALVGSTGISTGSHVHIRVNVDNAVCDPALLLPLESYA